MEHVEDPRGVEIRGVKWLISPPFDTDGMRGLLADPERAFSDGEVLKSRTVAKITCADVAMPLVIKRYAPVKKKRLAFWKHFFRKTRAERAWQMAEAFSRNEIPTPMTVAAGVERRFGYSGRSYLVTEALEGYERLDEVLKGGLSRAEKMALLDGMAHYLKALHKNGFDCRDLKAKNIFVRMEGPESVRISLVDLDMVRARRKLSGGRMVQNVARLNVAVRLDWATTLERLRFLRAYLGEDFEDKKIVRTWWNHIVRKSQKKLRKSLLSTKYSS